MSQNTPWTLRTIDEAAGTTTALSEHDGYEGAYRALIDTLKADWHTRGFSTTVCLPAGSPHSEWRLPAPRPECCVGAAVASLAPQERAAGPTEWKRLEDAGLVTYYAVYAPDV